MENRQIPRITMNGSLVCVKNLGFYPKTVIDVGAGLGTFPLYETFPHSHHLLIEPIAEHEPYLAQICRHLKSAEYIIAAASRTSGISQLQVGQELIYSTLINSTGSDSSNPYLRNIQTITLDEICQQRQLEGPYLIKVDVDGRDVEVLEGATRILKETEYLVIEATLFGQIHAAIDFMKSQGFAIYDILEPSYRPFDTALWQVDLAFVKESGQFRTEKQYAPRQQDVAELNSNLEQYRAQLIAHIQNHYQDRSQPQPPQTQPEATPKPFPQDGYVII